MAPTISVGMAQHHLGFAGSVTLQAHDLIAVVRDTVMSLARHGFTRFFFVNGHGGNIATVTAAFLRNLCRSFDGEAQQPALGQSVRCATGGTGRASGSSRRNSIPCGEGSHATASEVALTWYKYPETMNRTQLEPRIAPNGSFADAEDYRRAFPDGRIGSDPSQATPEHGKRFYDTAVEEVARDYEALGGALASAAYALAVQDGRGRRHDHGDAEQRQRVGHLAPYDVADGQRPQDRGVAERADHRESRRPSAAPPPASW